VSASGGAEEQPSGQEAQARGIHALPLNYEPMKHYVAKGQELFEFERLGDCVVCRAPMPPGEGLYAICSNPGCDGAGHLSCWSRHFLAGAEADNVLPVQGQCPKCAGTVDWGDMMKELTLRLRGEKEVKKLLNRRRRQKAQKIPKESKEG
jgi:structure-specific endonuclease subunit SLX1